MRRWPDHCDGSAQAAQRQQRQSGARAQPARTARHALYACADTAPALLTPGYGPVVAALWMGPISRRALAMAGAMSPAAEQKPSGVVGGLHAGYNWQTGGLRARRQIAAIRAVIDLLRGEDTFSPPEIHQPMVPARSAAAPASPQRTSCFTAPSGLAIGELKATTPFGSESKTHTGWTAGVGLEVAMTAKLVGPRRVSLHGSQRARLRGDWRLQRPGHEPAAAGRELPVLSKNPTRAVKRQSPGSHRGFLLDQSYPDQAGGNVATKDGTCCEKVSSHATSRGWSVRHVP